MNVDLFIDTNIFVYAHDSRIGPKHERATAFLTSLWERDLVPVISIQVLQELHVSLVRKGHRPTQSIEICEFYLAWRVVENTRRVLRQAFEEQRRWQLSFWDALILTTARRGGARVLWSEDFSDRQDYGGVVAVNPFAIENPLDNLLP